MTGNVSTAQRSSIERSPILGETASPPKPRKKLKRPPCNTQASKHRSPGIAHVGFDNERTGVLGYVPDSKCLRTTSFNLHSAIVHRFSRSFSPAQYDLAMIRADSQLGKLKVCARSRNRDQELIRLDSFAYGYSFAFGMALLWYIWAK